MPEKNLNYRTQLLHSHLRQVGSECSTHLKVNYNNLMPLVAGLHWKSPPRDTPPKKWEGKTRCDACEVFFFLQWGTDQHHACLSIFQAHSTWTRRGCTSTLCTNWASSRATRSISRRSSQPVSGWPSAASCWKVSTGTGAGRGRPVWSSTHQLSPTSK